MKHFIIILSSIGLLLSCSRGVSFDIEGRLTQRAASTVYLVVQNTETDTLASAPVRDDNTFRLRGRIDEPTTAFICDDNGNALAMLMTRGLTEMARLGVSLGASKDTFAGLAGVGDLIVTCTSEHSRNHRAGALIGQGFSPKEAMERVGAVVEGYYAAEAAWQLCQKQGVEMPIVQAAYAVLYEGVSAEKVLEILLSRGKKAESEDMGWQ